LKWERFSPNFNKHITWRFYRIWKIDAWLFDKWSHTSCQNLELHHRCESRDPQTYEHLQIKGLYPCGEGAGYAGGIISAAIDGENALLIMLFWINKEVFKIQ
jgi:hypothetical protein